MLLTDKYWHDKHNRKLFFDEYAKRKQFDALIPEQWHLVTSQDIKKEKVIRLLSRISKSFCRAEVQC